MNKTLLCIITPPDLYIWMARQVKIKAKSKNNQIFNVGIFLFQQYTKINNFSYLLFPPKNNLKKWGGDIGFLSSWKVGWEWQLFQGSLSNQLWVEE